MKSLSAKEQAQKTEHEKALDEARAKVNEAVNKTNELIVAYNTLLGEVETWAGEIFGRMEEFYDEKSEAWQESDTGQAYYEWKDSWDNADFSTIDLLDFPSIDNPLEDLTVEP